jgi:hypothetical protein
MTLTEKELVFLKEDILRFKNKLELDKTNQQYGASLSVTPSTNPRSNRGSKLDPTSDTVDRMKISSCRTNFKMKTVELYDQSSKKYEPKLVYVNKEVDADLEERIKHQIEEEFGSEDEFITDYDTLVDDIDDPYMTRFNEVLTTIKLDELMRPISKPSDVVNIKPINSIFKENFLNKLSNETVAIVEKEQEMVNLLNKTMDIFLHDDPDHIAADNLGLPQYDHHLDLPENNNQLNDNKVLQKIDYENDPFFLPPPYESDPKFDGIKQEEVDETRQLLQIALQRNEEYIRSLSQIRLGFLHADNYREQIYKWCKEMNDNELIQKQNNISGQTE